MTTDFRPAAPGPARFDADRNTWVLSCYADVYAALREPKLRQVSSEGEFLPSDDTLRHAEMHNGIQADMARMSAIDWRLQMESSASTVLAGLQFGKPVDLVRDVISPWAENVLLAVSGMERANAQRLTKLAAQMFYPINLVGPTSKMSSLMIRWRSRQRRKAQEELGRMWEQQNLTVSKSMLTGLTQTLPGFLAASWLALLQNPGQGAMLLAKPELAANAVEELLRYAGIVHSLYRRAATDVLIGETLIGMEQKVTLRPASANHDPERFEDPEQLDLMRRSPSHVGLGTGPHVCVGAMLIRMATSTITPVFLAAAPVLETRIPVGWTTDRTLRWPTSVTVRFGQK